MVSTSPDSNSIRCMMSQPFRLPELSSRRIKSSSVPCLNRSDCCLFMPSCSQPIGGRESSGYSYWLSIGATKGTNRGTQKAQKDVEKHKTHNSKRRLCCYVSFVSFVAKRSSPRGLPVEWAR